MVARANPFPPRGSRMIHLAGVTQHYGVRPVLREVDLKIPAGRLTAIVGPNGMGKTTLLGVMAGVLSPQKGTSKSTASAGGRTEDEELAIRRRVVYLPDHPWLPMPAPAASFCSASAVSTIRKPAASSTTSSDCWSCFSCGAKATGRFAVIPTARKRKSRSPGPRRRRPDLAPRRAVRRRSRPGGHSGSASRAPADRRSAASGQS